MSLPLEGITVVDFTHMLSGPSASLKLADLGARIIKIEHPDRGDLCRELYVSNYEIGGESSFFQTINRNKESVCLDLKNREDKEKVLQLIAKSGVVLTNFRPGVMARLGLDYSTLKGVKTDLVYGEITGFGYDGPWANEAGQDLLVQALSGLTWMSGNGSDGPVPMGIAIADILSGAQLAQGVLAALFQKEMTGEGALVQVSMMEAILDFQFEPLTLYYQAPNHPILRSETHNAHPLVGGAYGVYRTADGYVTISMGPIPKLGELLGCEALLKYQDPESWFDLRDAIKTDLAEHLVTNTSAHWLSLLEPADIWCSDVLDLARALEHPGILALNMLQSVKLGNGENYTTTRCPIRLDGEPLFSDQASPGKGEHTEWIRKEFNLQ